MWGHERRELSRVVVRAHEQIALVLIRRITRRRLRGRSQALEIEFVGVPLAMNLCHYVFVVVISV